jgi:hypothetical protein
VRRFHWKAQRLADLFRETLAAKEPPGAIASNERRGWDKMDWIVFRTGRRSPPCSRPRTRAGTARDTCRVAP